MKLISSMNDHNSYLILFGFSEKEWYIGGKYKSNFGASLWFGFGFEYQES